MAQKEPIKVQLYAGEEPTDTYTGTGTCWLQDDGTSGKIKPEISSVVEYLKDASITIQDEIDNYNTMWNWALSFFGSKKPLPDLQKFKTELDIVIKYLEDKLAKNPNP